jgi:hypothetical protein
MRPTFQLLNRPQLRAIRVTMGITVLLFLSGCATTDQFQSTTQVQPINLGHQALMASGIAFITPTSITGQEEDKQALALTFTEELKRDRPELRIVPLPETLSAINRAGLAEEYRKMYENSRLTGIFSQGTLIKISHLTGVRYLAQLQLGGFRQDSQTRWGFLGIRVVETETTSLRLYLQIWDGESGTIVWEGSQELTSSIDTLKQAPVTFKFTVEKSAKELIARLP